MSSTNKTNPWGFSQFERGDSPEMEDWNEDNRRIVTALAEVRNATLKAPYVGENLHFWIYDAATKAYIDSGISAPTSPATSITIGTVVDGAVAAAEITGEAPNQTLNLVLPEGKQGLPGTGTGYMLQADYDPMEKNGDAFDMGNMVETTTKKIMTGEERMKLAGIDDNANNYTHPSSHAPSIILQDQNNRFVTDSEKNEWNAKQPTGIISANLLINGNFGVNQRVKSGTVTLAAGEYGHDRWKGGASGGQYTFSTSENVTMLTIAPGKSIIQVVEGLDLKSGTVCLSWIGTALGKIGAGSFGASGITGVVVGGTNINVEFGAGTVSCVQLNYGSIAQPFIPKKRNEEEIACRRYFYKAPSGFAKFSINAANASASRIDVQYPTPMRVTPTTTFSCSITPTKGYETNIGCVLMGAVNIDWFINGYTADAEL